MKPLSRKALTLSATLLGALSMTAALTTPGLAYTGEKLAAQAKITIAQAKVIALNARAGKIIDEELEKEGGGLRYSFDIKKDAVVYEVGVDAMSGKVLENDREGAHPD